MFLFPIFESEIPLDFWVRTKSNCLGDPKFKCTYTEYIISMTFAFNAERNDI